MNDPIVVHGPAKLNLHLSVLGRRDDGFHELDTVLLAIDREDRIEVRPAEAPGVHLTLAQGASADVPLDGSNLAARGAACALALAPAGAVSGVHLRLEKRVPSQAGLGGGSSDAAAACLGTARLLGLDPDDAELTRSLASVGSDCPFFLAARATGLARGTGRGEQVTALDLPESERAFVVLTPEVHCATPTVFAAWSPEGEPCGSVDPEVWFHAPITEARAALRNDLEGAAIRSHPELAEFRRRLDGVGGAHFRLSGSGSSFFGLFEDSRAAEAFLDEARIAGKARDHGLRAAFVARPATRGAGP